MFYLKVAIAAPLLILGAPLILVGFLTHLCLSMVQGGWWLARDLVAWLGK